MHAVGWAESKFRLVPDSSVREHRTASRRVLARPEDPSSSCLHPGSFLLAGNSTQRARPAPRMPRGPQGCQSLQSVACLPIRRDPGCTAPSSYGIAE